MTGQKRPKRTARPGRNRRPGAQTIRELAEAVGEAQDSPEKGDSTGTADEETVSITGEIRSIADNSVVVDDGTGRANLTTLFGGFETKNVGEGDCAQASGVPFAPEEDSDNDIRLLVREAGLADGRRTDGR